MLRNSAVSQPPVRRFPANVAPPHVRGRVVPRAAPPSPMSPSTDVVKVQIPALNWSIPNVEGKRLSVAIYAHLAEAYGGRLTKEAAQEGLRLYGAVVDTDEARQHPGSHPNIDLLLRVLQEDTAHELLVERTSEASP